MVQKQPKTILITGATKGLGFAMVQEFIKQGHTILGCGRSEKIIEELKATHQKPHDFSIVNIAQEKEVQSWAKRLHANFPMIDLIVNNAALINKNNPLWEVSCEEFSQVIDVNIKGSFHIIRHFVPAMLPKKEGVIVNFSSGWGRSTAPEVGPYCTTKWAIEGMSQTLAQELPRGMCSVALNPGIINTEMLQSCFGEGATSYPSPTEWAQKAVPFLLGLSAKENGQALSAP